MFGEGKTYKGVRIRKDLLVWGFVLVVMAAMVVGGARGGNVENVETANENTALKGAAPAHDVSTGGTIQSITFKKDAEIRDALRFLAAKYQKNIVPSSKVDGLITVASLYDVTFEEAMDAILGYGFKYEQEGNFIKVYTTEEYEQIRQDKSRMIYKVFTLYYVAAAEAKKLILPVLSDNGEIEVTTAAETGVPVEESISAPSGGGDGVATNDAIIVYDYPENVARAEKVMASLDVRPKQILIEATILSATLTEDMDLGIDWQTLKGSTLTALSGITETSPSYLGFGGSSVVSATAGTGLTVGFPYDDVAAFIRAIETVTDTTILANPKILAVNKQVGQVYIGSKLGYILTTTTELSETQEVAFLDTGTKLSFRPFICDDGYIRMDIHAKDSSGALNALNVPDETSAELVSNIMVKDGQTIVIGGLFRDKITTTRRQIPVLGDLPIVGWAFRGTTDQSERQEVMVLLTPHIITEPQQAEGDARAADVGRKRIGLRKSLQWANRTRIAEDRYKNAVGYYARGKNKKALNELNWALSVRPDYIEALRLKERIIRETVPNGLCNLERVMLEVIDREESRNWLRR
jgi:type II secretory pathway component GspD/PulD (secretin)